MCEETHDDVESTGHSTTGASFSNQFDPAPLEVQKQSVTTLYLDCGSGIAGDMLLAALIDLGADFQEIKERLGRLQLPDVTLECRPVKRHGFAALKFDVTYPPQHSHRHLSHIERILKTGDLGANAFGLATRIFRRLGEAEASVHGTTIEKVHFHEVGAVDSIMDIAGIAVAFDMLGVQQVYCSPIVTGYGTIRIDHGDVGVPAPATALLLRGFPTLAGNEAGEMTTPTGAAVLATLARPVAGLPAMTIHKVGVGAGSKELTTRANVVRAYLGMAEPESKLGQPNGQGNRAVEQTGGVTPTRESLWQVECHWDDWTGQCIADCQRHLLTMGVADCFLTSVLMKKGRPGILMTVLVPTPQLQAVTRYLLQATPTLGVRYFPVQRDVLEREACEVATAWGNLPAKKVVRPDGTIETIPEHDPCAQIASNAGIPVEEVKRQVKPAIERTED